jgi:Tfp pilus assembly protein PilX
MRLILVNKPEKNKSERGFILVVVLIAILILIAVGFFALTTISGDLMITYRLVGERKALSAAEAGVYAVAAIQTAPGAANAVNLTPVDSVNDPSAFYQATAPTDSGLTVVLPGNKSSWSSKVWAVTVTGTDTTYNSRVAIAVGLADEGAEGGTQQGKL